MFRNFHNSRGLSTNAGNQNPRWRIVFIALLLVLALGSVGQTPLAQAAPTRANVRLYMDVVNPKNTLCVGESVSYIVKVYSQFTSAPPGWTDKDLPDRSALPGIKVEATSVDQTVGDFIGAKKGFVTRNTGSTDEIVDLVNPNAEPPPHSATFTFKAKKAGKTTLYFEGLAHGQYVDFPVSVKVINCKYKVITTSKMSWSGDYGSIEFLGVIIDGRLTADPTGYIFTGKAPVVWLSTSDVPNCGAKNSLGIGKVDMRGNLNDSGQLLLQLNYDPVEFADIVSCPGIGSGGGNATLTASPLRVILPTSGIGVVDQQMEGPGAPGTAFGSANVYVIPVEDTK